MTVTAGAVVEVVEMVVLVVEVRLEVAVEVGTVLWVDEALELELERELELGTMLEVERILEAEVVEVETALEEVVAATLETFVTVVAVGTAAEDAAVVKEQPLLRYRSSCWTPPHPSNQLPEHDDRQSGSALRTVPHWTTLPQVHSITY